MISYKNEESRFIFRVAGLIFHDEKLLVHRMKKDDFYALPGGRVEMMENTEITIVREMKEELNIDVKVSRLLWIGEQFFEDNGEKFHELCFYYGLECNDKNLNTKDSVFETIEDSREFEFKWVPISKLKDEEFYPLFIKDRICELPTSIEKFVEIDDRAYMEFCRK
jgi:ADP-ribose pyrophosphatase YjhB (NUDIX family)